MVTEMKAVESRKRLDDSRNDGDGPRVRARTQQWQGNIDETIQAGLESFYHHSSLTDVIVRAGSVSRNAHKVILAAASPYFHALFTSPLASKQAGVIDVELIEEEALEPIVDYIYSGNLSLTCENVISVLAGGDALSMDDIVSVCCMYLSSHLCETNAVSMLQALELFQHQRECADLYGRVQRFVAARFESHASMNQLEDCSYDILHGVLQSQDMLVSDETVVLKVCVSWLRRHSEEFTKDIAEELFSLVRMPQMEKASLLRKMTIDSKILAACAFGTSPKSVRDLTLTRRKSATLFVLGSLDLADYLEPTMEFLDPISQEWATGPTPREPRENFSASPMGRDMVIVGGIDGKQGKILDSAERFCRYTNTWVDLPPMLFRRSNSAAVEAGGLVFVIGGYNGKDWLDQVEVFDPEVNKWKLAPSMDTKRISHTAVAVEDSIYVIGGLGWNGEESQWLTSIDRFSLKTQAWEHVGDLQNPRVAAKAVVVGGEIVIFGGNDGRASLSSVECFDPKKGSGQCTSLPDLPMPMENPAVAVLEDSIFVIYGHDEEDYSQSVATFDPFTGQWTERSSLRLPKAAPQVVTVD